MGIMRFFAFIEFCKKSRNQKILISRNFTPLEYHVLEYISLNNILLYADVWAYSQSALTYSKLTIETLEQGVKHVQS